MKHLNFWFDMDGVLVKYNKNDFIGDNPPFLQLNKHYFRNLEPDNLMVKTLRYLHKFTNHDIYILTTVSSDSDVQKEQISDKSMWLNKHCPFIDIKNQFIPVTDNKTATAINILNNIYNTDSHQLSPQNILIDDFNKNLNDWKNANGTAVKYINGVNNPDSFDGHILLNNIRPNVAARQLLKVI